MVRIFEDIRSISIFTFHFLLVKWKPNLCYDYQQSEKKLEILHRFSSKVKRFMARNENKESLKKKVSFDDLEDDENVEQIK